ncbi:hypothetical protein [Streptomyces decoyicus]|nr:hypothetical protein [Streptomyces decoyicus]QZY14732.1 hypothetical protein K7C20_05280 [Streptomyces decoyicus]
MADPVWGLPAAGGSILDRWSDIAAGIAPQLPATSPPSRRVPVRAG